MEEEEEGEEEGEREREREGGEEEEEEEDSSCSRKEEKTEKEEADSSLPRIASPSPDQQPSFNLGTSEGGRGGSSAPVFDDALDGLPTFGQEEDDEDWHFALKSSQQENSEAQRDAFASESKAGEEEEEEEEEEDQEEQEERAGSTGLSVTCLFNLGSYGYLLLFQTSEAAPVEDSNPPVSPSVNIKEEPIDEGYDAALLPQSSIRQIKEELEHQEVGISYLINPFICCVKGMLGRGDVSCEDLCSDVIFHFQVLLKGQTAFQRKGSTQLFCSTVCLTGHLPPPIKNRSCFQCNREIIQPRDMITIPAEDSTFMHFCGQFCLSVFRHKKKQTDKIPDKWADKRPIEHEVTHQGRLHRLCSDACFVTWRKIRQLAMNCCEGCGLYCNTKSGSCQTLTIERSQLNFCGPTCISTYKQTCRKTTECAYCHKTVIVSSTIMERDQKGKVQLYCSLVCVEKSRPPQHNLTGTPFPCCLCKVTAVPQYHLAMVDGTIRNFCSYTCVSIFRKSGHTSQPDLTNGASSLRDPSIRDAPKPGPSAGASSVPPVPQDYPSSVPYPGHHPSHTSVPPLVPPHPAISSPSVPGQTQAGHPLKPAEGRPGDASKLTCHQCSKQFNTKPLLFSHQVSKMGHILLCGYKMCCEQYKTQKNILAVCEWCKQDKVIFDIISYNQQDLVFCSENCKLLFKHDLTSRNKEHAWRPCTYCSGITQKMLHSHYGGKLEEFCRPHCMSQYTVLYYGMGRCDSCRKQGYMTEKLQCLGSVRNFCNLPCVQQYCHLHFETSQHSSTPTQPHHSSKMNPVIADVVSLANGSATQPSCTRRSLLLKCCFASTQTDAMRVPSSRRRQMKNKSVLCRPFTVDQEIMCQLPSTESGGEDRVKVIMVPVPVPVFIPVPMNMYSQHTPVPLPMPMPVGPCALYSHSTSAAAAAAATPPVVSKLNHLYGVKAWRSWVRQHKKQPQISADLVEVKEDVLQCNSAELSFGLSRFIKEVRRPNGETYSPDSIFYLCLGIQQHLFMMGRIENIFTDQLYSQFASEISGMLRLWKPKLLAGGAVSSRVEESYLWECKQLGAYSPIVLLNTLLFFCTKHFHFNTVEKHQRLSFSNFTRHSKPCSRAGKVYYLRFQRSGAGARRQVEAEGDLEMMENVTNPLHCPVRLYEFYLSRCPESVKKRTNVFYLQPEQNVHTHSPHWYTSQPLDATTLQSMLTRILAVREVQKEQKAAWMYLDTSLS
uniref:Si:ch211-266o15.1 n=1 Tax=Amphilophus citrinellus TaxID=61819 RepID=A0A3Q0T147_AMPCI